MLSDHDEQATPLCSDETRSIFFIVDQNGVGHLLHLDARVEFTGTSDTRASAWDDVRLDGRRPLVLFAGERLALAFESTNATAEQALRIRNRLDQVFDRVGEDAWAADGFVAELQEAAPGKLNALVLQGVPARARMH
jgi:hypothetical protein